VDSTLPGNGSEFVLFIFPEGTSFDFSLLRFEQLQNHFSSQEWILCASEAVKARFAMSGTNYPECDSFILSLEM
jgi:hypothetical protein